MNLNDWRKAQQKTFGLPGGLVLTMRRVDIKALAIHGDIPAPLLSLVEKAVEGGMENKGEYEILSDLAPLIAVLIRASAVSPPIADEPSDTAIALREIPGDVQVEIFNWLLSEVAALRSFREQQRAIEDGGRDSEEIPAASVSTGGNR
jgi:hypothetical protein